MNKEFRFYKYNDEGQARAGAIAEDFDKLLSSLLMLCPESRELAICKTKLEEACFFAKKSLANNTGLLAKQTPEPTVV